MNKTILKLEIHDDEEKKKVMKTVSDLSGVDSISMDMEEKKLTVIGNIDPVNIVSNLRKLCHTEIVSVGPAKQPGKKKDEGKEHLKMMPFNVDTSYNPRMATQPPPKSADDDTSACCACVIL